MAPESKQQLPSANQSTETLYSPEKTRHNKIVVVTGVTCSGKDFLLKEVFEDDSLANVNQFSLGTMVGEYHGKNRDQMLGVLDQDGIRVAQVASLSKILENTPAIVNTHIVARYRDMYLTGPQLEIGLNPQHYIVVAGDPEQIVEWRIKRNRARNRNSLIETPREIELHQNLIIATTQTLADYHGSRITIVRNLPTQTTDNVSSMRDIIKGFL